MKNRNIEHGDCFYVRANNPKLTHPRVRVFTPDHPTGVICWKRIQRFVGLSLDEGGHIHAQFRPANAVPGPKHSSPWVTRLFHPTDMIPIIEVYDAQDIT